MMTFRKNLGNQMTGPSNQIPVLKHQRHVTLERGKRLLAQESKWRLAIFSLLRKKKNSLHPSHDLCPQTAEAPHCCTVHPHSRHMPSTSGTECHRGSEQQLPLSHHGRGCAPQQGNTSSACLPPPGSQHGALPVHAGRSSSAFPCPPRTNTHMGPSCAPWPLSQQGAPSRRAEKDRGCKRKEKEAAML